MLDQRGRWFEEGGSPNGVGECGFWSFVEKPRREANGRGRIRRQEGRVRFIIFHRGTECEDKYVIQRPHTIPSACWQCRAKDVIIVLRTCANRRTADRTIDFAS